MSTKVDSMGATLLAQALYPSPDRVARDVPCANPETQPAASLLLSCSKLDATMLFGHRRKEENHEHADRQRAAPRPETQARSDSQAAQA